MLVVAIFSEAIRPLKCYTFNQYMYVTSILREGTKRKIFLCLSIHGCMIWESFKDCAPSSDYGVYRDSHLIGIF